MTAKGMFTACEFGLKGVHLRRYRDYRAGALTRNILFDLSPEQFLQMWQKSCSYCGKSIETIGIDRIKSNEGYTINNVIPCCKECNRMKINMNQDEFIERCKNIGNIFNKDINNYWNKVLNETPLIEEGNHIEERIEKVLKDITRGYVFE